MIFQLSLVDITIPMFLALREGLEAVLVVVIILLYLKKTNQRIYYKYVYLGIVVAVQLSIAFAVIFTIVFGGFSGVLEEIFEGTTFIISGIFILTLVLWVSKEGSKMRKTLEEKVEDSIKTQKLFSITITTFIIIIREGIELVLLTTGAISVGSLNQFNVIIGSIIGLAISIVIGLLIFYGIRSINLRTFFKITNVMLILFAAGLITYGVHEFIEASIEVGIVSPFFNEVWNIKHILPESFPDGNPATPEFLEIIGALLKALFGYNANPSLLEVIIYPTLLISISLVSMLIWRKNNT
ncbi:MAG: FTR1 family protein [Candidatus Hermodarchaeota archaeon]